MLDEGTRYQFYFMATDNDAIHGGKTVKSRIFTSELLDKEELMKRDLESQQSIIGNMDRSLEKFEEQEKTLERIKQ